MAAVGVLIDTHVFIDYFNTGRHASILEDPTRRIYYSIVTRKELLAKEGLRDSERQAIVETLRGFRLVPINRAIAGRYSRVRTSAPWLEREDALIAATAVEKRLRLFTGSWRHFRRIEGVRLYVG